MIYQRSSNAVFTLDVRWSGYPRIQLSTGTTKRKRAEAMLRTLEGLRDAGRRDIFSLLASRKLRLHDVHDDFVRNREALEHRVATADSPELGRLLDEWFLWLGNPATLSPKSRRAYAPRTTARYRQSWEKLLAVLPKGRSAALKSLTAGFIADFRAERKRMGTQPGTINRDLCALESFLSWARRTVGPSVARLSVAKEEEPDGRERWLTADEVDQLRRSMEPEWWPLFYFLLQTGARIGEAQGLTWSDVNERSVSLNNRARRLKTRSSSRVVPVSRSLWEVLDQHRDSVPARHSEAVFPGKLSDYRSARRAFLRAVKRARLDPVRIHDLRHTFGVHATQSGVPLPRLQKLMGHSTHAMTMRYLAHSTESYFEEDAARIDASLNGAPAVGSARLKLLTAEKSA